LKKRRASRKNFLSRRAIENRLGSKLFAEPWPANQGFYWVKHLKPENLATVLVLTDRSGQHRMETVNGGESLYNSLLAAMTECDALGIVRRLKGNEVVVFDLDSDNDQSVIYRVVDLGS